MEYGIIAIVLVGTFLMVALGKVSWDIAAPIISGDVLYALGSSKGAATVNAIKGVTDVQQLNAANTRQPEK